MRRAVVSFLMVSGLFLTACSTVPNSKQARPVWMNADGEINDSSAVESGYGRTVEGLGDWQGEIVGKPAHDSAFNELQIGMPLQQVVDLIGPPTDEGGYITGKAFIPFYFGSDRHRYELAYKGLGRLVFAGEAMGSNAYLIWIIHSPTDSGYR